MMYYTKTQRIGITDDDPSTEEESYSRLQKQGNIERCKVGGIL